MNTTITQFWLRLSANIGLVVGLAYCASLSAGEVTGNRTMMIYSDTAGAPEILSGQYKEAIDIMLQARGAGGETAIIRSNNLCVAYTLVGALESALDACDRAVREATLRRNYGDWFKRYASFRRDNRYESRAFANRSVLRTTLGDTIGAAKDLERTFALD